MELIEKIRLLVGEYGPAIMFYSMAAFVLGTAALAVLAKKIDHGAFALMGCFSGVAALYVLLGSDFIAVAQVIVYVGGIMILVVFGVMLTDRLPIEFRQVTRETAVQGLFVAIPVAAALVWAAVGTPWPEHAAVATTVAGTTAGIGNLLLTDYLFPFEFSSVLLLVALVGAARLARGGKT